MRGIPDDPIIECMMRTGYPPWMQDYCYTEDDYFVEVQIPLYPDEEEEMEEEEDDY